VANHAFYAIAVLACNLLTTLRVMELPDDAQGRRIRTIIDGLRAPPHSQPPPGRHRARRPKYFARKTT
jgi:hypothetical protein